MNEIGSGLWQATARIEDGQPEPFIDVMERGSVGLLIFETPNGGCAITALHRARPDAGAIGAGLALAAAAGGFAEPALDIAPLPAADWLAEVYAGFPARRIGRFYVHGTHVETPPPPGALALHIDAATAFGSGEHATTEGCLLALSRLARRAPTVRRVLDMGTGSGILAIGAAKLWPGSRVAAVDIDAESARVAGFNARLNQVAGRLRAVRGDGYRAPLAARGPKFDVILSNILARPLVRMAPSLGRRLAPGGVAILSGLLRRQAAGVLSAHRAAGLRLEARIQIGEWRTLIVRRP
jgi:ribosomal protein L11 methyltransferase